MVYEYSLFPRENYSRPSSRTTLRINAGRSRSNSMTSNMPTTPKDPYDLTTRNDHSKVEVGGIEPLVQNHSDMEGGQSNANAGADGDAEDEGGSVKAPFRLQNRSGDHGPGLFSMFSSDEESAPPPPDLRRNIHIPSRTSSNTSPVASKTPRSLRRRFIGKASTPTPPPTSPSSRFVRSSSVPPGRRTPMSAAQESFGNRSSAESYNTSNADSGFSCDTPATSVGSLPALQQKILDETERLSPLQEDDPRSFDLVIPNDGQENDGQLGLEKRSELLFSREHLEGIFDDPNLLFHFTNFLSTCRPKSMPSLIYFLDSLKALKAINYANAISEALEPIQGRDFSESPPRPTINAILEEKSRRAFDALVRDDLPAYITHTFVQVVSVSIQRRITGTLPPHLRDASEGLAEVFCLTDPSRTDNPIIFASEEFHRTTQYGVSYAIGRNCRFLQGPRTNPFSVERIKNACESGKEHSECFLNYRRDGSPFLNLLMLAPLMDSRGKVRYFIGAQVDVTGLLSEFNEMAAMQRLIFKMEHPEETDSDDDNGINGPNANKDEFQQLAEMLNHSELETIRKSGGRMHRGQYEDDDDRRSNARGPRVLLKDLSNEREVPKIPGAPRNNGKLAGVYSHYLLLRPAPSLRILFTSPSLRVPGILQSPFLSRIGGSSRVRDELAAALGAGRGVTAKIRWLSTRREGSSPDRYDDEGRPRWIHCTPLLGHNGAVGVWMVVLVDEEGAQGREAKRRFRNAPPVAPNQALMDRSRINQREWDFERSRALHRTDTESTAMTPQRQVDEGITRAEDLEYRPSNGRDGSTSSSQRYVLYSPPPAPAPGTAQTSEQAVSPGDGPQSLSRPPSMTQHRAPAVVIRSETPRPGSAQFSGAGGALQGENATVISGGASIDGGAGSVNSFNLD